jgi:hypothetical protein
MATTVSPLRLLGLSVGLGYVGFATYGGIFPHRMVHDMLGLPEAGKSADQDMAVGLLTPLMAARDLTIATIIFTFFGTGQDWEMGLVIVSGTILCYADVLAMKGRKSLG